MIARRPTPPYAISRKALVLIIVLPPPLAHGDRRRAHEASQEQCSPRPVLLFDPLARPGDTFVTSILIILLVSTFIIRLIMNLGLSLSLSLFLSLALCLSLYLYSLNSLSVRVLYIFSNNLASGYRGAKSVQRVLFEHFYYKTKVKLTVFTFLTRGPQ